MIRARHVFVYDGCLCAVYGPQVEPINLRDAVLQLDALSGVEAGAVRMALDRHTASLATVLWARVLPQFSADSAQKLFRQLTQPELPIAIARLDVLIEGCRCGKTTFTIGGPIFLPEFGPEDVESFDLRLYAALQQLDVGPLVEQQPRPPYKPLGDALDKLLAELGAYTTELYIEPNYDYSKACPHRDS